MELLEGGELLEALLARGNYSEADTRVIIKQARAQPRKPGRRAPPLPFSLSFYPSRAAPCGAPASRGLRRTPLIAPPQPPCRYAAQRRSL